MIYTAEITLVSAEQAPAAVPSLFCNCSPSFFSQQLNCSCSFASTFPAKHRMVRAVWETYSNARFKKTFRVSKQTFLYILSKIEGNLLRQTLTEEPISPAFTSRLAMCLYKVLAANALRQKNQIEAETYIIIIVIIYEFSSMHAKIDV